MTMGRQGWRVFGTACRTALGFVLALMAGCGPGLDVSELRLRNLEEDRARIAARTATLPQGPVSLQTAIAMALTHNLEVAVSGNALTPR